MARQVKAIYNKTRGKYWRDLSVFDHMRWVPSIKTALKFNLPKEDDYMTIQLGFVKDEYPNDELEIHSYEVIPKQYKKVD